MKNDEKSKNKVLFSFEDINDRRYYDMFYKNRMFRMTFDISTGEFGGTRLSNISLEMFYEEACYHPDQKGNFYSWRNDEE